MLQKNTGNGINFRGIYEKIRIYNYIKIKPNRHKGQGVSHSK